MYIRQIFLIQMKYRVQNIYNRKKYIDQEPPYLMRQICVLQWEEIKTKNSGATHHFGGKRARGVE